MAEDRLVVATPWYPTPQQPYAGTFVRGWLRALGHPPERTLVIHLENVLTDVGPASRAASELGEVLHVPVPVTPTMPRPEMARRQLAALAAAAPPELERATAVHAHVGMPTAWAVSQAMPSSTRLVVTEHASYLRKVLADPEGRAMYGELVGRAAHVLTVAEVEARLLRATFPDLRHRVTSIGNPVATELFPLRRSTPTSLRRWVYVGSLRPTKGVDRVVRAFAAFARHADGPTTLTLVGQGAEEQALRDLADELGVASRVRFRGPVEHDQLSDVFAESDLLVHLSHFETFGLTVIEAALSGLPVVVTLCGGPEETLADAAAEGAVQFVPVGSDVEPVLAAVSRLEAVLPTLNPGAVRANLEDRFGEEAFGERVREVIRTGTRPPAAPDAPVVVALALSPRAARRVVSILQAALRAGARAVLVTNQPDEIVACDPRTRVVDLRRVARLDPMRLLEYVLLAVPTRLPLLAARGVLRPLSRAGTPLGRRARGWLRTVERLERGRNRALRAFRSRVTYPFYYSWVDPWRLGFLGMRRYADEIARDGVDVVVHADEDALPLAWRLARRHPGADVVGAVSGTVLTELVARRAASRHAPEAAGGA